MPAEPIAEYLARSLSAYYAYFGALFLYLAFHLPRNVAFVRFLALAGIAWGAIDALAALASGLPACWTVNGAFGGAFCAAVWLLARRIDPSPDRESDPHDPA
ncbi:MAG: hypothetical protein BWZ10_01100 [candidate division BRC1 bacterium ADurb.BinA364]|nr:MAG: hypothetical protein BWZ10_01100 [candidate division BRC1 bacterium ADurb.BinA364]